MFRTFAAYLSTIAVVLALDLLWLGFIAGPWYQQGIGHLMAEQPDLPVAALFYAVFAAGLMVFAVAPGGSWLQAAGRGALFGFFAYATYDLTNLATLRGWPLGLSLLDMGWGTLVGSAAAALGSRVSMFVASQGDG